MSNSNYDRFSIVQRTSFDTAAALNMLLLPIESQDLTLSPSMTKSRTIRTDANVDDHHRVGLIGGGSVRFEPTFPVVSEAFWYLLRAVLRTTETAAATEVTSVTSTSNVLSVGSGNVETGVEVGDVLRIRNASNTLIGYALVTAVDTGAHTVTCSASLDIPDAVTTYKVLRGARMKNGTSEYFFDGEVGRTQAALYELFRRWVVNGFELNITDGAIATASFQLMIPPPSEQSASASLCLGHTAPTAGSVFSLGAVPTFDVAGVSYTAKQIGLRINNNIRARTGIKTGQVASDAGFIGWSWGDHDVSCSIQTYMQNFTEIAKATAGTESNMHFVLQDSSGKAVSFSIPAFKWDGRSSPTSGLNQDDYFSATALGKAHSTQSCTIRVQRWA
jgi:hypothetical protein